MPRVTDDAQSLADQYRNDPVAYAWEVHGVWLWGKQAEIARSLVAAPYRVMAKSANGVGKTLVSGLMANWFYDCYNPGECIITGPVFDQIKDTTFKEIRRLRGADTDLMPKAPRLESAPDHYVTVKTANTADAFQGTHSESIMLLFEEAMGVDAQFWEAARGIKAGGSACFWFSYLNPTNPSGTAFLEEQSGRWKVISISAFEHPNIAAELTGRPAPIPGAVRLEQLLDNMDDWADTGCPWPTDAEAEATDVDLWSPTTWGVVGGDGAAMTTAGAMVDDLSALVEVARGEFVPVSEVIEAARRTFRGRYWRPNPVGEARVCGRYPRQSAAALFSEAAFDAAARPCPDPLPATKISIGCDVARYGDDKTSIHVRRGRRSLKHVTYHGQNTTHTAGAIKDLCREFAELANTKPERIPCYIDDDGVGGGVTDQADGFNFIPVHAQQTARDEEHYPNGRSEMLFDLAERMADGGVSLALIDGPTRDELKRQAIGVTYEMDAKGRRHVESSKSIKKRLGRSPDDLVAVALAYYEPRMETLGGAVSAVRDPEGWRASQRAIGEQADIHKARAAGAEDDRRAANGTRRASDWSGTLGGGSLGGGQPEVGGSDERPFERRSAMRRMMGR